MPAGTLFQTKLYGAVVLAPSKIPLSKNSTLVIVPSLSAASAVRVRFAGEVKTLLFAGAVMLTVGGVLTVMVIGAVIAVAPWLSVALAVSWWVPSGALFQMVL